MLAAATSRDVAALGAHVASLTKAKTDLQTVTTFLHSLRAEKWDRETASTILQMSASIPTAWLDRFVRNAPFRTTIRALRDDRSLARVLRFLDTRIGQERALLADVNACLARTRAAVVRAKEDLAALDDVLLTPCSLVGDGGVTLIRADAQYAQFRGIAAQSSRGVAFAVVLLLVFAQLYEVLSYDHRTYSTAGDRLIYGNDVVMHPIADMPANSHALLIFLGCIGRIGDLLDS